MAAFVVLSMSVSSHEGGRDFLHPADEHTVLVGGGQFLGESINPVRWRCVADDHDDREAHAGEVHEAGALRVDAAVRDASRLALAGHCVAVREPVHLASLVGVM